MKERLAGFLADDKINHNEEIFDYIKELHEYLWRFIRVEFPSAGGRMGKYLDVAIEQAENRLH